MYKFYTVPLGRHSHVWMCQATSFIIMAQAATCVFTQQKNKNTKKQKKGIKDVSGGQGIYMKIDVWNVENCYGSSNEDV